MFNFLRKFSFVLCNILRKNPYVQIAYRKKRFKKITSDKARLYLKHIREVARTINTKILTHCLR